jgi:hypothetical protein
MLCRASLCFALFVPEAGVAHGGGTDNHGCHPTVALASITVIGASLIGVDLIRSDTPSTPAQFLGDLASQ